MKPHPTKAAPPPPTFLLTVQDVASRLDVSVKTVRRLIARGDLPARRIGRLVRVAENDLQAFIHRARR